MVSSWADSRRGHWGGGGGLDVRSSRGHGWNLPGVWRGVCLGVLFGALFAAGLLLFLPFFFAMVAVQGGWWAVWVQGGWCAVGVQRTGGCAAKVQVNVQGR